MKKIISLILVLIALLSCAAMAEELVPVTFEDGFQISLPGDWLVYEPDEEMLALGIAYVAASPDGAYSVQISWSPMDPVVTIEELHTLLVNFYPDATIIEINGINFLGFTDAENDVCGFVAMDAADEGYYTFWFTPASDEAFVDLATSIVLSISNVEE